MGWFRRNNQANEDLEKVQLALAALQVELDRERTDSATTRRRIQDLETKAATTADVVADAASWSSPTPELSIGQVRALAEQASATTEAHSRELVDVHARLTAVDARLAELTDTITNQLGEIAHDLDRLESASGRTGDTTGERQTDTEVDSTALDGRFDELRANQTRIANEQARFAKSLHEQLAALADELRRAAR